VSWPSWVTSSHRELAAQVLDDGLRHVQRIGQEQAQRPHRRELQREPQPVMHASTPTNQRAVRVVEEEDPLELYPRRRAAEATVRTRLRVAEELNRHRPTP